MFDNSKDLVLSIKEALSILLEHEQLHYITIPIRLKLEYINILAHTLHIFPMNEELKYVIYQGKDIVVRRSLTHTITIHHSLEFIDDIINEVIHSDDISDIIDILLKHV